MNRMIAGELVKLAKELISRSPYHDTLAMILREIGRSDIDPRHVEAYLSLEHRTLDEFSRTTLKRLTVDIVKDIDADPKQAERLAESYGI